MRAPCSKRRWHLPERYQLNSRAVRENTLSVAISRRQFLRGDLRQRRAALRPPWALDEAAFLSHCDRCGACAEACETGIIALSDSGYPAVRFDRGECTFCRACVRHCTRGALAHEESALPWMLRAVVGETCLSAKGILCGACAEPCGNNAISFPRGIGAMGAPVINMAACNGCGACVAHCPTHAIVLAPTESPSAN